MKSKNKSITLLAFIFISFLSCSKNISSSEELDESISKIFQQSSIVGFSAIIIQDDKIKYQNSFGYSNIEKKVPYNNDTKQIIASISKTVIGLSLLKAVEQGHFTLETPINDILPFKITNPNHKDQQILIKHLATHTSGLKDIQNTYYKNHYILKGEDLTNPLVDSLKNYGFQVNTEQVPLGTFLKNYYVEGGSQYNENIFDKNPIGSNYNYSNIASSLAAYLIEVKSGIPFTEYSKKFIFDPLGMERTNWGQNSSQENAATLYWSKTQALPRYESNSYADGSLNTTNNDMAKYMIELMSAFKGRNSKKVLSNESYALMFKKQFESNMLPANYDQKENNSGIFWIYFTNGRMGHTGSSLGAFSILALDPKTKTGFFIMTNNDVENIEDNVTLVKDIQEIISAIKKYENN